MRGVRYLAGLAMICVLAGGWAAVAQVNGDRPPAGPGTPPDTQAPALPGQGPAVPVTPPGPTPQPNTPAPVVPDPVVPAPVYQPTMPVPPPAAPNPNPNPAPAFVPQGVVPQGAVPPAPAAEGPVRPRVAQAAGAAEEQELGPGQEEKNPTGRQEPAVSIEWIGPPVTKLGRPADYTIAVRNVCNIPVQQVVVRIKLPQGMNVMATEPKAGNEGNVLMWDLGTLPSKQERNLQLRVVSEAKGVVGCQAWVTFTGSSSMRIKVSEPKLAIKVQAPEKVLLGDPASFMLTVHNPGDGPAEQVKIVADLSAGLDHSQGKRVEFPIGNLTPGESRSVQLVCATKLGGVQTCDAQAMAEGDLRAQDKATVNVIMPKLELEATGPKLRYLDRPAVYMFKVTNTGDAPATNVTLTDLVPDGFKFTEASDGGRHDFSTRTVNWFLGELGPAQSKTVQLHVIAVNPGEFHHKASAQAARGLRAEGEVQTRVEGLAALLLEVVDTQDPIEVGADTSYEIRVTNTGTKTETDVKLSCTIPDKMQLKTAQGPVRFQEQGREVVFEPLPKLAPRADAIYRIHVKALAAGVGKIRVSVSSTNLQDPVIEQEATRIYED